MAILLLTAALSLLPGAWAQEPAPVAPTLPVIEQVTATWWITEATPLQRWPDGGPAVRTLAKGDEVEVIVREGDLVRVRKELDFGWVPSSALSEQPPAE